MRAATAVLLLALMSAVGTGQSPGEKEPIEKEKPTGPSKVGGRDLAAWIDLMQKSEDASVRADAIGAILQFGPAASKAVPALLEQAAKDQDISPRTKAMAALRYIEVEDRHVSDIVSTLAERIDVVKEKTPSGARPRREQQAVIRLEALMTLGRFYKDAASARKAIISSTTDSASWEIRHQAVAVLWRLGTELQRSKSDPKSVQPPDAEIVKALLAATNNNTHRVRLEAIMGLGALGKPDDAELRTELVNKLTILALGPSNKNAFTRARSIWAYIALHHMNEKSAKIADPLKQLAAYLKPHNAVETRIEALGALSTLGKDKEAKKHLPDLVKMIDDKELFVAQAACTALQRMGDTSPNVLNKLIETIKHKEPARAAAAITALVNLNQHSEKVIGAIEELKTDKTADKHLQFHASQALEALKKQIEAKSKKKP